MATERSVACTVAARVQANILVQRDATAIADWTGLHGWWSRLELFWF